MAAIVRGGLEAGALGFSTGRTAGHRDVHGHPVPGTHRRPRTSWPRCSAPWTRWAAACFQVVPSRGRSARWPATSPAPWSSSSTGCCAGPARPTARSRSWSWSAASSTTGARGSTPVHAANAQGAQLRPQVGNRCFGVLMGHQSRLNPFRHRRVVCRAGRPAARRACGPAARPRGARPRSWPTRPIIRGPSAMDQLGRRTLRPPLPARRRPRLRATARGQRRRRRPRGRVATRGRSPTTCCSTPTATSSCCCPC